MTAEEIAIPGNGKPQFGSWDGRISLGDGFFDPLTEEELTAWEGYCGCDSCGDVIGAPSRFEQSRNAASASVCES